MTPVDRRRAVSAHEHLDRRIDGCGDRFRRIGLGDAEQAGVEYAGFAEVDELPRGDAGRRRTASGPRRAPRLQPLGEP